MVRDGNSRRNFTLPIPDPEKSDWQELTSKAYCQTVAGAVGTRTRRGV
jgi:hypothetical protein